MTRKPTEMELRVSAALGVGIYPSNSFFTLMLARFAIRAMREPTGEG